MSEVISLPGLCKDGEPHIVIWDTGYFVDQEFFDTFVIRRGHCSVCKVHFTERWRYHSIIVTNHIDR